MYLTTSRPLEVFVWNIRPIEKKNIDIEFPLFPQFNLHFYTRFGFLTLL